MKGSQVMNGLMNWLNQNQGSVNNLEIVTLLVNIILAIAAILAGYFAFKNIVLLKQQSRVETFLKLLSQMSSQTERQNRAIVNGLWDTRTIEYGSESAPERIAHLVSHARSLERQTKRAAIEELIVKQKDAIEETVSCLDIMGFFLMSDSKLKGEAPEWIWSITSDMWVQLGEYVVGVQNGGISRRKQEGKRADPNYGRYFRNMASEAEKHLKWATSSGKSV